MTDKEPNLRDLYRDPTVISEKNPDTVLAKITLSRAVVRNSKEALFCKDTQLDFEVICRLIDMDTDTHQLNVSLVDGSVLSVYVEQPEIEEHLKNGDINGVVVNIEVNVVSEKLILNALIIEV